MPGVTGAEQFAEFADDVEDFKARVPDILDQATENTAERLITEITRELRQDTTSQGGTYDSRTSPYSPGGENDSSTDNFHITDRDAWKNVKISNKERVVSPIPAVADRARYIAFGTRDHEPDGDIPMYFKVNGVTIVLSDTPPKRGGEDVPLGERFEGEPTAVSGVESTMYFAKAIARIKAQGVLQRELNKAFVQALEDSF
jgi:hypothetical protein